MVQSDIVGIQDIVDDLLAKGYVSTEQAPDFTWTGATYHVELYSPPLDSPEPAHLLVSKTANGQTILLEQITGEAPSLDTALQPLSAGWQPMTHMLPFTFGDIALSNAPHLFYCQKQCEPGRERVGYLWLDEDGNLQHTEPFLQFAGWATLVQGDVVYHAVAFHDGSFPFAYIYGDAGGSVTTSLKIADLLKNPGPPVRFELSQYQLAGKPATDWNDINGDGAPEIIIVAQQPGTNVCASEFLIVQIQPDGSLSQIDTPACVQGATDVDMDGIVELLVGVQRLSNVLDCSGARSCWSTDIYQWDGAAYVPADYAQFADYYLDRTLATAAKILNKPGPLDRYADGYRLEEIMLTHHLLGRDNEGLAIFDRYTNPVCHKNGQDKVSLLQELRRVYNLPPESNAPCPGEQSICTLQQEFKLANLPLDDLARLDFVDDDTLALAGWGPRPTPPVYGDSVTSPRRAYYQAVLNLSDATVEPITPQFEPLNNPCGDSPCALDVLDQSPDGQWQLLHIWANGGGAEGAWLVSTQDARRLGEPFVPFDSFWQWAQDGSLLWYQRVGPGYGLTAENYVVRLASPPLVQAIPVDWDYPLDANGYRPAFSPVDKTIYSVRRFETDSDHFEWPDTQQHHFDFTQDLGQPIARETVPHLAQITWNEATQSFWQVFIDDGVTLAEINGKRWLSIPFTFFEAYMESIANGTLELIDIIPQSNITIGPAGRQVALNIRGKRVLLFECGDKGRKSNGLYPRRQTAFTSKTQTQAGPIYWPEPLL